MFESVSALVCLITLPLLTGLLSSEQQNGLCCVLWPQQLGGNREDRASVYERRTGQRGKPSRGADNSITQIRCVSNSDKKLFLINYIPPKEVFPFYFKYILKNFSASW